MRFLSFLLLPCSIIASIVTESINYPPDQTEIHLALEGIYEKREIPYRSYYPDGKEVEHTKTIVIFNPLNSPIQGSSVLTIGNKTVSQNQKNIPFFLIGQFRCYDEFASLLGKQVFIEGFLEPSNDLFFLNTPQIHLSYVIESKWKNEECATLHYEPAEVILEGKIYEATYQDESLNTCILALDKPVHVEGKDDDDVDESEMYVREVELLPPKKISLNSFINERVSITGTLFHSHTVHHHRRVLCDVKTIVLCN